MAKRPMTEYEHQKLVDFINALDDTEKTIAKEILDNWHPQESSDGE